MFHLLTFVCFLASLAFVARLNKSNRIFWTLCVSGLLGFAAGSFYRGLTTHEDKKVGVTQVNPMQAPDFGCFVYEADVPAFATENNITIDGTIVTYTEPAGQDGKCRDIVPTRTLQAFSPDYDIGDFITPNTS